ncbi:MAG TPA: type II toxin-antitoxin system VapC family toxin [Candidatus Binatia bacterium]|nr:type II toxin-antitoxin system VapC family toxin [Candidatus Binatia bacterium]
MKLLLDTHAFIWWDDDPSRLGAEALAACTNPANELLLSAASVWEMQIKASLGKLQIRRPLSVLIADQQQRNGLQVLPITLEHVLNLDELATHHKDPFDRLIVSTAKLESCQIVSHDRVIARYGVSIIW